MPTIAIITGHAITAGLVLAICHDYVFMKRDRCVLSMTDIDLGTSVPDYVAEVIRSKVVKAEWRRNILLRGVKVKADEAVLMGLVDVVYDSRESVVAGGLRMGEELANKKWDGEVYAELRKSMYPQLCKLLGLGLKLIVKSRL